MIISYITNQITIPFLQKEEIPRRSVVGLIVNVFHSLLIFGEIVRGGICRQYRNICFDIIFHIRNILFCRIYKTKIILLKKCIYQFVKVINNVAGISYHRFIVCFEHKSYQCVCELAAQVRCRKWNFAI